MELAREHLERAQSLQTTLADRHPGVPSYRVLLAMVQDCLAMHLKKSGHDEEARSLLQSTVSLLEDLSKKHPEMRHVRFMLFGIQRALSDFTKKL